MRCFSRIKTKVPSVKTSWKATTVLALIGLSACSITASTPEVKGRAERLEPTGQSIAFDATRYADFEDYIIQTRAYLRVHKVYLNPNNADEELDVAEPFSVRPHQLASNVGCEKSSGPTRGVVLLHGLSDMLAAMEDIAIAFAERCFVSYSLLLPGHGARPAEMLNVSREDWLAAARFGVDTISQEVDEVYVGGFSLGGLIALQTAMNDSHIEGVFAFSPAIALRRSFALDQTIWLRHLIEWADTDPPDDAWRFEAIPFNALAETQLLARSVRAQLKKASLEIPIFIAQSPDDGVVDARLNQSLFEDYMRHSASRLLSYTNSQVNTTSDARILKYASVLPEQRILSYAHQAVHISPDNSHYSVNGDYRNCRMVAGEVDAIAINRCQYTEMPFRGEVFGHAVSGYDIKVVDTLARLTFNPQFPQLLDEIDLFLDSLAPGNVLADKTDPGNTDRHQPHGQL